MSTFATSFPKKHTIGSDSDDLFKEPEFQESRFDTLMELLSHYNRINDLKKFFVGIIATLVSASVLAGIYELWF
ncbi:MAG: hypothetical protein K9H16_01040 [Bacteroidales bacterium]|nr:hypothetical protein [Bacteroidales bacterium]